MSNNNNIYCNLTYFSLNYHLYSNFLIFKKINNFQFTPYFSLITKIALWKILVFKTLKGRKSREHVILHCLDGG